MRLTKIKLAGFKSFVDPTAVGFPSNLVGVVGPNGCGKSNIIDAVRWVMGEISAKHLRGDSMADVIFNGSGSRKPVGHATVELVFDNSDGKLAGEYAAYSEVSLKRVVERDGQSSYFLNGARCRRKDITQLFLGTGLGSRSYAIIEQNMISRVIEARPEDMRSFLEEAAGISRYKERRKETEGRIAQTRENLERLNDLREEVEKQLRHLQRQAATARRYQTLKQEERQLQAEVLALKLREAANESTARQAVLSQRDLALQAAIAEQRSIEAAIERARHTHDAHAEALSEVQGRYYEVGAEISRTEQSLEHSRELRGRQRQEREQISQSLDEATLHRARDLEQSAEFAAALQELGPGQDAARARERDADAALLAADHAMQEWQQRRDRFNEEFRVASTTTEAERARLEGLEHQGRRLTSERERVQQEQSGLMAADPVARLHEVEAADRAAQAESDAARGRVAELTARLQEARTHERETAESVDTAIRNVRQAEGQLVSLEALQRAALGQGQGKVVDWLKSRGMDANPRLAQQLTVDAGWERAVETVLGSYLEAVCVESLEDVAQVLASLTAGTVTFFAAERALAAESGTGDSLRSHVQGPAGLDAFFDGVIATDNLREALDLRSRLKSGQSVITRDGVWIGPDWLRVSRDHDAHEGVLEREGELRRQRATLGQQKRRLRELETALETARASMRELEDSLSRAQEAVASRGNEHLRLRAELDGLRAHAERRAERLQQIAAQLVELENEVESADAARRAAAARLEAAVDATAQLTQRQQELDQEREDLRQQLASSRQLAEAARNAAREIEIRVESRRTGHESLLASIARLDTQLGQFASRIVDLETQIATSESNEGHLRTALEEALARRLTVEQELAAARRAMEEVDASVRDLEERRGAAEAQVEDARQQMETIKFSVQELRVRREALLEQFAATRFELEAVSAALPEDAAVPAWELRLTETGEKIDRLGQVNLAAIDEFREQSERKEYLDRQHADLADALATLEDAIRKIDRETRSRFQDTFDRVNAGLKDKFPRLFGGGNAYLELTGEDLLESGVAIMARPPGKRNSSISQLSGGEKALTAVALVFSIFELNPAPFCLLDEVDAPLDENNVGRFCDIVRDMSSRVQFVFVTHNKATMEMANQLLGVTMNEPGVSRLVAVDVDEAVRLAAV
jgi:chromosome segregation protein